MSDRVAIETGLDFEARQAFMTHMAETIAHAVEPIEVDCSALDNVDEQTLGLLVVVARSARRRNLDVILRSPTTALLRALAKADVSERFLIDP
jgi:anti-anti-sigma regulatory factor